MPDILANAGGVAVSYFEWVQNRMGYYWEVDEVNSKLEKVIKESFEAVLELSKKHKTSLRMGVYALAIKRVDEAMKLQGSV